MLSPLSVARIALLLHEVVQSVKSDCGTGHGNEHACGSTNHSSDDESRASYYHQRNVLSGVESRFG